MFLISLHNSEASEH